MLLLLLSFLLLLLSFHATVEVKCVTRCDRLCSYALVSGLCVAEDFVFSETCSRNRLEWIERTKHTVIVRIRAPMWNGNYIDWLSTGFKLISG